MRRVLLAAVVFGAVTVVAPSVAAASPDVIHGGCFYDTDQSAILTGGMNSGVIGDFSITTTGDTPPLPIGATVSCWIEDNGVAVPGTTHSYGDIAGGAGVQAGTDPVDFAAGDVDDVRLCQSVTFADHTTIAADCPSTEIQPFPPQVVIDLLNAAFRAADNVVCPALVTLAGNYGPITIGPDGDVYGPDPLELGPFYDCPPYGAF